jgi:acyl-CoA reductase-like NAD-dependent aldehyde dehydrogenase
VTRFEVITPVDGSVYLTRETATAKQIDVVLAAAARAAGDWAATPVEARVAVVERMVTWMLDHADDIAVELAWQMGRPVASAAGEIRRGFQERARHMAGGAPAALADADAGSDATTQRIIRRRPLGVVAVLAPWNYPYLCSVNTVVPALLAGNAVVLKTASQTPLVAERYAAAFAAAGLPEGVFGYLHLGHDDVAAVIADDRVGYVAFTGSVEAGHVVQRAAAGRFIATGLELGGKDPAYVRPDADLDHAVAGLVDGAFFNSGQSCCGVERIYVHRDVYDGFVEGFVELARAYVLDDPLDPGTTLGPMVRASAAAGVRDQVTAAVAAGATSLVDPAGFPRDEPGTAYVAPRVLVGVDHSMAVMTDETFGPVVGIMAVDGDDEAVTLMNDSRYGLTASVWTADADAALAIGGRIDTGTCYMNRCDYVDPALAWTGVKDSGRGVSLSPLGFDAVTRPQSFHLALGGT